jgi:hypothetical protein
MPEFKIKVKRGTVAPGLGSLDVGELGFNTATKILYVGNGSGQSATAFLSEADVVTSLSTSLSGLSLSNSGQGDVALSGTLGAGSGGTGISTYTAGDLLVASGATSFSKLGKGSNNTLLRVNGSGTIEWWAPNFISDFNAVGNYSFSTIAVSGQSNVVADSNTDTLTLVAGSNVTITTNATSDSITIASAHPTVSAASSLNGSGRTYVQDITLDSFGHITAIGTATETVVDTNNYITGFSYTGGTTAGPTATITREGLGDLSVSAFPSASGSASGIVTTGAQAFAGDKTFNDDVIVKGSLTVEGTLLTKDANEVNIGDAIILLNAEETGAPSEDAGIEIERGTEDNAQLIWDESAGEFVAGLVGSLSPIVTEATERQLSVVDAGSGSFLTDVTVSDHAITLSRGNFTETTLSTVTGTAGDFVSGVTVSNHAITINKTAFPTFNQNTTGNAATATALQNARTIAGVSFDGTANIAIPLANLSTVTLTSPANGEFLKYNGTAWVNSDLPEIATAFLELTDTPSAYTSQGGKVVRVNSGATALEFADANDHEHSAADITSGTLGVARGGTGATSFTSGAVLVGAGTSAVTTLSRSGIDTRSTFPAASHAIGVHSDVTITSIADGEILQYSSADSAFVNVAVIDCGEYAV